MTTLTKNDADRIFHEAFNGKPNIMTPNIIRRGKQGRYLYELSRGDFMSDQIYGVTVLTLDGKRTDLSEAFSDRDQANEYIKLLRSD